MQSIATRLDGVVLHILQSQQYTAGNTASPSLAPHLGDLVGQLLEEQVRQGGDAGVAVLHVQQLLLWSHCAQTVQCAGHYPCDIAVPTCRGV